jgi:hypothetical protein
MMNRLGVAPDALVLRNRQRSDTLETQGVRTSTDQSVKGVKTEFI